MYLNDDKKENDNEASETKASSIDSLVSQTEASKTLDDAKKVKFGRPLLRSPRSVVSKVSLIVAVVMLIVVAYGGIYYYQNVDGYAGGSRVVVLVPVGDNLDSLATTLDKRGVISSATVFRVYLRLHGYLELQPGIYYFQRHEPYAKIFDQIKGGPSSLRLTLIPGWTLSEIAAKVAKIPYHSAKDFLKTATSVTGFSSPYLPSSASSVEGLVYPDTYFVSPLESDKQLLQTAIDRFDQVASEVGLSPSGTYNGLSPYQVVVVASIVQKEATTVGDMAKVARVILNRLAAGMNLQLDSTVRYATGNFSSPLTQANLNTPSPFNTYVSPGLPPAPISEPSMQALNAVLHPSSGSWLYFVALKGHSSESFFNTYAQQEQAISQAGGVA